jgi:hypothetical protein
MLQLSLWFNSNYNRKIFGKVLFLQFKAKFHIYIYINLVPIY